MVIKKRDSKSRRDKRVQVFCMMILCFFMLSSSAFAFEVFTPYADSSSSTGFFEHFDPYTTDSVIAATDSITGVSAGSAALFQQQALQTDFFRGVDAQRATIIDIIDENNRIIQENAAQNIAQGSLTFRYLSCISPAAHTVQCQGQLLSDTGRVADGARIALIDSNNHRVQTSTNSNGEFTIRRSNIAAGQEMFHAIAVKVGYIPAVSDKVIVRVDGTGDASIIDDDDSSNNDRENSRQGRLTTNRFTVMNEYVPAGAVLGTIAEVEARKASFDDVTVTVSIPELGVWRRAGPFDIDYYDEEVRRILLEIPQHLPESFFEQDYILRVTVSNDDYKNTFHRIITLSENGLLI